MTSNFRFFLQKSDDSEGLMIEKLKITKNFNLYSDIIEEEEQINPNVDYSFLKSKYEIRDEICDNFNKTNKLALRYLGKLEENIMAT